MEISHAYLMALTFLISFAITRIFKAAIEKQKQKNLKNINIVNPIGGTVGLEFSDDTELAHTILACISDN